MLRMLIIMALVPSKFSPTANPVLYSELVQVMRKVLMLDGGVAGGLGRLHVQLKWFAFPV